MGDRKQRIFFKNHEAEGAFEDVKQFFYQPNFFVFSRHPSPPNFQKKRKKETIDRHRTKRQSQRYTYLCVSSASKMISSKSPSNTNGLTFDAPAFGSGFWKLVCATNMTV